MKIATSLAMFAVFGNPGFSEGRLGHKFYIHQTADQEGEGHRDLQALVDDGGNIIKGDGLQADVTHPLAFENPIDSDVCKGGVFHPDPTKYYTIEPLNLEDLFWTQQFDNRGDVKGVTFTPETPVRLGQNKNSARAHWHFRDIPTEFEGPNFLIVNRDTGLFVDQLDNFATTRNGARVMFGLCSNNTVTFPNHRFVDEFPRCGINGCQNGATINLGPVKSFETRRTGCVPITQSCDKSLPGSGWSEISRDFIGLCGNKKTCRREVITDQQRRRQEWVIREVTSNYNKVSALPDRTFPSEEDDRLKDIVTEVALNTAVGLAELAIEKGLERFCAPCTLGMPLVSSLLGLTGRLVEEDVDETIDRKLSELSEQTSRLIDARIVINDIGVAKAEMDLVEKFFFKEYRLNKALNVRRDDLDELDQLSKQLEINQQAHRRSMVVFFNFNNNDPTSDSEILRIQSGFEYLKMAITENLNMLLEAFLLDEYANPGREASFESCREGVVAWGFEDKALVLKEYLLESQRNLIEARLAGVGSNCPSFQQRDAGISASDFKDPDGSIQFQAVPSIAAKSTTESYNEFLSLYCARARGIGGTLRDELEHDIVNLSYRLEEIMFFLDNVEQNAEQMCLSMRSDPQQRDLFASNQGEYESNPSNVIVV